MTAALRNDIGIYPVLNEILNAATHAAGFGLSIAGLVALVKAGLDSGEAARVAAFAIYGSSLILLYLFSTLYHSLYFTRARTLFKIFDHSCIYILIAGTYTPICLLAIKGALGWTIFGVIWGLAILGVVYKSIWINKLEVVSTVIYVAMGWLCMMAVKPMYNSMGYGFWLLLGGGLFFTVGAVVYSLNGIKFIHVLWHGFVLAGTTLMYFAILRYV